jgi:hypothetical protein
MRRLSSSSASPSKEASASPSSESASSRLDTLSAVKNLEDAINERLCKNKSWGKEQQLGFIFQGCFENNMSCREIVNLYGYSIDMVNNEKKRIYVREKCHAEVLLEGGFQALA